MQQHAVDIRRQLRHIPPPRITDHRHILVQHGDEQHPLMQHLIVLEVVQQGAGQKILLAGHENRNAGHPDGARLRQPGDEGGKRQAILPEAGEQQLPSLIPGDHQPRRQHAQQQRHIAALRDF